MGEAKLKIGLSIGDPGWIRTSDLRLRRPFDYLLESPNSSRQIKNLHRFSISYQKPLFTYIYTFFNGVTGGKLGEAFFLAFLLSGCAHAKTVSHVTPKSMAGGVSMASKARSYLRPYSYEFKILKFESFEPRNVCLSDSSGRVCLETDRPQNCVTGADKKFKGTDFLQRGPSHKLGQGQEKIRGATNEKAEVKKATDQKKSASDK